MEKPVSKLDMNTDFWKGSQEWKKDLLLKN